MPNITHPTHLQDSLKLWREIQKEFGDDVIVVYKPKGLNYHTTTSGNMPFQTMNILRNLVAKAAVLPAEDAAKTKKARTVKPLAGNLTHRPGKPALSRVATGTKAPTTRNGFLSRAAWAKQHSLSYSSKATIDGYKKYLAEEKAKQTGKPASTSTNYSDILPSRSTP
jgi:hypothetical protein